MVIPKVLELATETAFGLNWIAVIAALHYVACKKSFGIFQIYIHNNARSRLEGCARQGASHDKKCG